MNTKSHRILQLIADILMRTIVTSLVIFGSVSWFSPTTYTLHTTNVYANTDCANATIPEAQCEALVDIYNQMNGANRNPVYTEGTGNVSLGGPSSGWIMNDDPCSWHGVTCDTQSPKNVIGIHFAGYNADVSQICPTLQTYKAGLAGVFPASISDLSQLKAFNIAYNTGVSQSSLQSLSLANTLTQYCANNISLTELGASQFTGLTNLEHLYLHYNQISSLHPTQFAGLTNLKYLYLYNNQISSFSPTQFDGLANLRFLYFHYNQISSLSPTQFDGLANLQRFDLSNNQISSLHPTQFDELANLQSFSLSNNQISSLHPTQFDGLANLRYLYLNNNQLQSLNANQFSGLHSLRYLNVSNNQLTLLSPTQFQGLSDLLELYLNNNNGFTGAIPSTYSGLNFTNFNGFYRGLQIRGNTGNPNTICGQKPTRIQTARDAYFSGNQGNTDLDDLSWFGGGNTIELCPLDASCNTTADCASGLSCLPSGEHFTCQTPGGGGTGNQAPIVSLTSPTNNAFFTAPATVSLAATASDPDGTITQVEFRQGNTSLFIDTTSPYSYSWTGVGSGSYSLTAIATDNSGATTTSSIIAITVTNQTYTLTGTLGMSGANASVNVCGSTVTANSSGIFSRTAIPHGSNCASISATKSGYTCTFTTQGPNPLISNIANVAGTCTQNSGGGGGTSGGGSTGGGSSGGGSSGGGSGGGGGAASSIPASTSSTTPTHSSPSVPVTATPTKTAQTNKTGAKKSGLSTKKISTMSDATIKKHIKTLYNAYIKSFIKEGETKQNKNIKKFIILLNVYVHNR